MSWGRAFVTMLLHSLWIGPLLGMLVILVYLLFMAAVSRFAPTILFPLLLSAIVGLVIASPVCLVMGAIMLRLSERGPSFIRRRMWALAGVAAGALVGIGLSFLNDAYRLEVLLVTVPVLAFHGAIGALLARWAVSRRLAEMHAVDTEIFA